MILVYALTTIIVIVWLLRMIVEKRLIWRRTALDIPLALFLVSQIISTVLSMHPRTSMLGYYSRFHGGLWSYISYIALYYAFVSNIPVKAVPRLLITAFFSAAVVSIYGILEHFGNSPSCYILSDFKSFGVDCWIQKVQERVFASFGQPNWLAAYAITLIPVGIVMSARKRSRMMLRVFIGVSSLLLFLVLLYTKSRSGILGLGVGMAAMAGVLAVYGWRYRNKAGSLKEAISQPVIKTFIIFGLVFALISALIGTAYTPSISDLINQSNQVEVERAADAPPVNRLEHGGTDSGEIRKIVWDGAIKVWQRYPVFGSGVETFAYSYYQDRPAEHNLVSEWDFLYNKAHNEFLNFLATTGAVGLISYIVLLVWFGITALTVVFSKTKSSAYAEFINDDQALALGLLGGMIALSVSNFFGFSTVMVTVLMFLYFALIALQKMPISVNLEKHQGSYSAGWQFGSSTVIVLIGLLVISNIYNYRQADVKYSHGKNLIAAGKTQEGLETLHETIERSPNEALFYDELSDVYAKIAVALLREGQATQSAEIAGKAITLSDKALQLNDVHLNFYKTRARIFITLAQMHDDFLVNAKETLETALERSPTDAKLWYNLGLVEWSLENYESSIAAHQTAIELKPNYESARLQLAKQYQQLENNEAALQEYRYILEHLSPDNPTALEAVENIETQP